MAYQTDAQNYKSILTNENGEPPSYSRKAIKHLREQTVPADSIRFTRNTPAVGELEKKIKDMAEDGMITLHPIIEFEIERNNQNREEPYVVKTVKAYLGIEVETDEWQHVIGKSNKAPQSISVNTQLAYKNLDETLKQLYLEAETLKSINRAERVVPRVTIKDVGPDGEEESKDLSWYAQHKFREYRNLTEE